MATAQLKLGSQPTAQTDLFSVTTILLQSVGFCLVPQTCAYIFTARSAKAIGAPRSPCRFTW